MKVKPLLNFVMHNVEKLIKQERVKLFEALVHLKVHYLKISV